MAFKPNYNFQKAERDRAKAAKKEHKAREKAEAKLRGDDGQLVEQDAEPAEKTDAAV